MNSIYLVDDPTLGTELRLPEPPEVRLRFRSGGHDVALIAGQVPESGA